MIQHMSEQATRDRLEVVFAERREIERELATTHSIGDKRNGLKKRLHFLETEQRELKSQLHRIVSKNTAPGSINAAVKRLPVGDIPDDGFITRLMMQRAVVDAFKVAYKTEGDYLGELIAEAQARGLINPDGTPRLAGQLPFGVVPTLEEAGRPLGVVSGFHTGPGPHFPQHDVRHIYANGVSRESKA